MKRSSCLSLMAIGFVCSLAGTSAPASSARQVPVAYEVDIVIAGGGCGAVAAAVEAAKAGASVFVAAPRNYLGDDIAGAMQLWLEPDEKPATPLARAVFSDMAAREDEALAFTYKTDLPSAERHLDTHPPSLLSSKHAIESAAKDSVEYDGDVTISADLGVSRNVKEIEIVSFSRRGDFQVGEVCAGISEDGKQWKDIGTVRCEAVGEVSVASLPVASALRCARLTVKRAAGAGRLLLASVRFIPARGASDATPSFCPRPLHVKTTLEEALRTANVNYLFGCYATDLLTDKAGKPAGLVMANRMGRQAVIAKVVIDATEYAILARAAGARFDAPKSGQTPVAWVTIAGQPPDGKAAASRRLELPVTVRGGDGVLPTGGKAHWFEHTMQIDLSDCSWPAVARMEQTARDRCYVASQLYSADTPFLAPPHAIKSAGACPADWPGARSLDLAALRPAGIERLWVLSGCADAPRACARKLIRPVAMMDVGARVGAAAAEEAKRAARPEGVKVAATSADVKYAGDAKELLQGLRPLPPMPRVPEDARLLPVLGNYDVVVVGGGTAGAAAGIGAARQGARTLVVEHLHALGGVGTVGMIGKYYCGNRVGFTATVPQNPTEVRMEFLRSELRKAGADIWFGSIGCGALVESNRVTGVVVATPCGRGVVLAKAVVDGTGNSEIAAAAGAETRFVEDNFAVQHAHVPPREIGSYYINGNIPAVDGADPLDVRQAMEQCKQGRFDRGQIVDSRERQRIVGDYCLDWLDQINRRTFPDSIALGQSDYDSHGYQIHPFFTLRPARPPGEHSRKFYSYIPYRCLLPRGWEGILVVGLGLSAHRDAMPIVRMQPDLQNSGYAAGVAAAMAAKTGVTPRRINLKALQQHLVEIGNLEAGALQHGDSYPMPRAALTSAVQRVVSDYDGLDVLLAQPQDALPLLRAAYDAASGAGKLAYAHVLGVMGDSHGLGTLLAEAQRRLKEKDFRKPEGKAIAKGRIETPMDDVARLMWALGSAGDRRAVPPLCDLANETAQGSFHRLRATAVSLGLMGDPAAAPTLAALLQSKAGANDVGELLTACALYRCGDKDGQARRRLEQFVAGSNGPHSRLAWQVLGSKDGK